MSRVLLTGGSGFVAAHILERLLANGHSVVTTVRNEAKAAKLRATFPSYGKDKLDFAIVADIAQADAFDKAVISDPPFQAVIHTASPFHFNAKDIQKDLIDPAVVGTIGILKAVAENAPSVERVVITSSFAALYNPSKGNWPEHTYTEADVNPMTLQDALANVHVGYTGSKSLAEKAAWDFVKTKKPTFSLTTICPSLVFGPIYPGLHSLDSLNTSNQMIFGITQGAAKESIPDIGGHAWVDVRNVASAHVAAIEKLQAAGRRYLLSSATQYNNRMIVDIIRKHFSEYMSSLPSASAPGGNFPEGGVFKTDPSRSEQELGIKFIDLEVTVVDTVRSFQATKDSK